MINQKVIELLLKGLGYRCDVVANGQEAVEAFGRIEYDGVLMDCQMPQLDGFAATGEIHTSDDALKMLMAGADVAMLRSALLRHGIPHLATVREGIVEWMTENEYTSVAQLKGSMSQRYCPDPTAFEDL